jgi:hypothetical protein
MDLAITVGAILAACVISALGVLATYRYGERRYNDGWRGALGLTEVDHSDGQFTQDRDFNGGAPTLWSDAVAPGGLVCAAPSLGLPGGICGFPVESEPCPEHAPSRDVYDHERSGL